MCMDDDEKVVRIGNLVDDDERYARIRKVFDMAYHQVAHGKGEARHATKLPLEHQISCRNIRRWGIGAALAQIAKKTDEVDRLPNRRAMQHELLGIIAYAAMTIMVLEEWNESDEVLRDDRSGRGIEGRGNRPHSEHGDDRGSKDGDTHSYTGSDAPLPTVDNDTGCLRS